jgi:hypothetical protein
MADPDNTITPDQIAEAIAGDDPVLKMLGLMDRLQRDLRVLRLFHRIAASPDTWSLIVKLDALFEAAFIHLSSHELRPTKALED